MCHGPDQAALARSGDETQHGRNIGIGFRQGANALDPVGEHYGVITKKGVEGQPDPVKAGLVEPGALQSNDVEAGEAGAVANDGTERDDVSFDTGHATYHGAGANPNELMDSGGTPDERAISDGNVPTHDDVIGNDHIVAEVTIMSDVNNRHQKTAIADTGDTRARDRTAMDGAIFTYRAGAADDRLGIFTFVLEILRRKTNGRERIDFGVRSDPGAAVDHDMGEELHAVPECDLWADSAKCTDTHARPELRAGRDQRCGMNHADIMQGWRAHPGSWRRSRLQRRSHHRRVRRHETSRHCPGYAPW